MSEIGGKLQEFFASFGSKDGDDHDSIAEGEPYLYEYVQRAAPGHDHALAGYASEPTSPEPQTSLPGSDDREAEALNAASEREAGTTTGADGAGLSVTASTNENDQSATQAAEERNGSENASEVLLPQQPEKAAAWPSISGLVPRLSTAGDLPPAPASSARSAKRLWTEPEVSAATDDSDQEQEASLDVHAFSVRSSLPRAVRKGRWPEIKTILERSHRKSDVREVLTARHVEGGCGLLMIAAKEGRGEVLVQLATEIQEQLGTGELVRQLREGDEENKPLLFYSVASDDKPTFAAAYKLLRKVVGSGGLDQQLQQKDAKGRNVLMHAARGGDEGVWTEVWNMLKSRGWLNDQLEATDEDGKGVFLYAAEAGNAELVTKIIELDKGLEEATDNNGWNSFMYAARGSNGEKVLKLLHSRHSGDQEAIKRELTRKGLDGTNLLTHAAIGGQAPFGIVRKFMASVDGVYASHPGAEEERVPEEAKILSWAARGGGIKVLAKVAEGIKADKFEDGMADAKFFDLGARPWYDTNSCSPGGAARLKAVVIQCAKTSGGSLFISAVESGKQDVMKAVVKGIKALAADPEECWCMLCGFPGEHEGNPLSLAASKSVVLFNETLKTLEEECDKSNGEGSPKIQAKLMPVDGGKITPLYGAVCSNDTVLFDQVLAAIKKHFPDNPPAGRQIITQVGAALDADEGSSDTQWISAIMLPKVLKVRRVQAARDADRAASVYSTVPYDLSLLDGAVRTAVNRDALDHLSTLARNGCHIDKQFPVLLSKIGENEKNIKDIISVAVAAARNPFVVCAIALDAIRDSGFRCPMNRAALRGLQDSLVELMLELLEHLPHSVYEVGAELARGDRDMKEYVGGIGKVDPRELLGFVAVRWMLERSVEPSSAGDGTQTRVRIPLLVHAVSAGTDFLDLLSAPLVVDYLRLEYSRTLPSAFSSDPFERNINQVFYSYTAQDRDSSDAAQPDIWQRLLQLLQGWDMEGMSDFPHRSILPGLQFNLAGILGKPGAFYPVPAVRMYFATLCYLGMMILYLSSVQIEGKRIPAIEWLFYLVMAGTLCREVLEFVHARKSLGGPPSVERYFSDAWNFLDVATILIVTTAFVLRLNDSVLLAQLFLAVSAPLLFSRVLFLSQIGSALGPMTQVIFTMLRELATFSVVLGLVMVGFATCFTALYGTGSLFLAEYDAILDASGSCDLADHPINGSFGHFGDSLLTLFAAMLGAFDFGIFDDDYVNEEGDHCGGMPYRAAGVALLVAYLIIMTVMLLNLLIAVLSTAHFEVYQNADKQFHLARAKIILQSRDDVLHDVLPPPFSLIKPIIGVAWPVRLMSEDVWEVTIRTIHRVIFALVVGLTSVALITLLWIVSIPWVAWSLAGSISNRGKGDESSADSSPQSPPATLDEFLVNDGPGLPADSVEGQQEQDGGISRESLKRVFFVLSDRERLTWTNMFHFVTALLGVIVGTIAAGLLCLIVYPLLSLLLWGRGVCSLQEYVKKSRSPNVTPWVRKQMGLGEDGKEWDSARRHAVKTNESYRNGKPSSDDFNVAALLTTTTGMTMENLRQKQSSHTGLGQERELVATLEEVLARFREGSRCETATTTTATTAAD